ncbi:MAG: histidine kinase [Ginsengibacter sp.]
MKKVWYSKRWVTIVVHALAWILLFSLPYLLTSSYNNKEPKHIDTGSGSWGFMFSLLMNITWVIFFYLNAHVIMPRFFHKRKYLKYSAILLLIFIWILLQSAILKNIFIGDIDHFNLGRHVMFHVFVFLSILSASIAYQLLRDKQKTDKLAKERENENLKTELSLLRSQVSPHFMFNVLNNMVSLARKKSDLLEPSLIKLSSLMRYMLYETEEEKVSLEKEIDYLHSYIDLQQQRFGKKLTVNVSLDVGDDQYQIEPMLLIPFVENAFKHGTGFIEGATIQIDLSANKNILQFNVRNKYNALSTDIKDASSGIGLNNVSRRLNLLYSNEHTLMITKEDNWFVVSLQINLN